MDPHIDKYKDQAFQVDSGKLTQMDPILQEKFYPISNYVNNLIYEYKNKVTRCDICLIKKKHAYDDSTQENKYQREEAKNIATELYAYGSESGYQSNYDDACDGGQWYSSKVFHDLWTEGKSIICDNCLEKFIKKGLFEDHEDEDDI